MVRTLTTFGVLACLFAIAWPTAETRADGFIVVSEPIPMPPHRPTPMPPWRPHMPLEVAKHHVEAEITDTVAVTEIDQTFYNPNSQQLEGTYIFPLADEAAVERFSMFMDGKEVSGEVLNAEDARRVYESIVSKMRDPALLEYVGSRMFKARVFPIPAQGEVRIRLSYSQTLRADAGLVGYTYPLNTEKFSAAPLKELGVRVKIRTGQPMRTVFCPTHDVSIDRSSERAAVVGYEAKNVHPDKDFSVYYQTSDEPFGLSVLTYRESSEDGFFMARVSPPWKTDDTAVLPKDVCFVFDTSGSMAGKKIEQAKAALEFCIANLNEADRFNVLTFSTEVRPFRDGLIGASKEARDDALAMVSKLGATGGTNINDALLAAMQLGSAARDGERPFMIIFLTDGLPTVGTTDVAAILGNVKESNKVRTRLFAFGLGDDVNTRLLDKLAEENHGTREYVSEQEDLEVKLSSFYQKVASPVLGELSLAFGGAEVYDVYPKALPDLFKGSEVVVFGRYSGSGDHRVTLRGEADGGEKSFEYDAPFAKRSLENDFLPQLWAIRKVGYLLDELRLHGETRELKDEIIALGKRYGIITPYTSYLIAEEAEMQTARGGRLEGADLAINDALAARPAPMREAMAAAPADSAAVTGAGSVAQSMTNSMLQKNAGFYGGAIDEIKQNQFNAAGERIVNQLGAQTFYKEQKRWVDSRYDGKAETVKVKLFSQEYFELIARHPELRAMFAQGSNVIVVFGGNVYETTEG